jgi:hypothetical protein
MTTKVTHGVTSFNPGQVIQSVYAEYTANADLATVIPTDDTIPAITEGVEVVTAAITPKYATSKIRIRFTGTVSSGSGDWATAALFRDAVSAAIAAAGAYVTTAGSAVNLVLSFEESASSVTARTYRIRVGGNATTVRMNGSNTTRHLGGTQRAVLIVEEIAV